MKSIFTTMLFFCCVSFAIAQDCETAATLPYYEDFNTGTPQCWSYENTDATAPVWAYTSGVDITGDGNNDPILVLFPPNVSAQEKDDWAFSKKIELTAGTSYTIEAVYNSLNLGNATASENFELAILNDQSSTASFLEVLGTYNNILQQGDFPGSNDGNDVKSQAYIASETFTPSTSGEYYIGIHALGSNGTEGGGFLLFSTGIEEIIADCSAATVPYLEDFSNGDPECWTIENTDEILPEWTYNDGIDFDTDGTNDPVYVSIAVGIQFPEKDDWIFSQKIQMEAGTTYYLSSHYNAVNLGNGTSFEDFELWVTNEPSSTASFSEMLNSYVGVTQEGQFPGTGNGNDIKTMAYLAEEGFTPTISGEYHVAIHSTGSSVAGGGFLIFDMAVNEMPIIDTCADAATAPYFEDFSEGSPECWTYENTDETTPEWSYNATVDITGNGENDPIVAVIPNNISLEEKDDWAFTKKISMTAGIEYLIETDYNALNLGNATANENFELVITDAPSSNAAYTNVLATYNNILQQGTFPGNNDGNDLKSMAYSASETFTPTTTGDYYVAVHTTGASGTEAGGFLLFNMDVKINVTPSDGELIILPTGGFVTSVNYNGSAAAGYSAEHFLWNETEGFQIIGGVVPAPGIGGKTGISDDGLTIGASSFNSDSGLIELSRYDVATQTWTPLGGIGGDDGQEASSSHAISGDATTIVGLGYTAGGGQGNAHAISWTEATGMVDLGSTVANAFSRANATNLDGTVIGGWQDQASGFRQGAVWINGVQELIEFPNGDGAGEVQTISNNGAWVGGIGNFANNFQAWRWNQETGIETLGPPTTAGYRGVTSGLNEDGTIAIGYYRPNGLPAIFGEGFIWTEAQGVIELNEYAASLGIDTQGVILSLPLDISADGSTIVGSGRQGDATVGFVLKLAPTILNVEDVVSTTDFIYYPNPVENMLTLKSSEVIENVTIFNISGQQIMQKQINALSGTMNLEALSSGIYLAQIKAAKTAKTVKLIKK
ncbi:T9SS type A sorting domain-containing protein [Cochleicola gelatinilyticus]|uniref:Secretion system C-terminal sorting domain-containing protein n=1 Tax=Cochleicola gelatinilyticus TaxID=1763537 RepID=A0A167EQ19_9FLAO|nr:T9SS type A sorting domain-containing protein [Cochleicola gelatinilyticus]OAB75762.1 hypothetical protein ULVI_14905 [Cochleicola gelatinilyticus]